MSLEGVIGSTSPNGRALTFLVNLSTFHPEARFVMAHISANEALAHWLALRPGAFELLRQLMEAALGAGREEAAKDIAWPGALYVAQELATPGRRLVIAGYRWRTKGEHATTYLTTAAGCTCPLAQGTETFDGGDICCHRVLLACVQWLRGRDPAMYEALLAELGTPVT